MKKIAYKLKKIMDFLFSSAEIRDAANKVNLINRQLLIEKILSGVKEKNANSLMLHGYSVYSQNEEDGIINKIFSTLGVSKIHFLEFGVAEEENNTSNVLLNGGKGCWYDKRLTKFKNEIGPRKNLKIFDDFITLKNIKTLVMNGLDFLGIKGNELDLLSLDLDGNDYYFIEEIHKSNIYPKVYCLEYNGKFAPPADIKIKFSEQHSWAHDDYFSCSIQAYINLLGDKYSLLVCNITGINAFFIRKDLAEAFTICPVWDVYQPPRYYLLSKSGHKPTSKYLFMID